MTDPRAPGHREVMLSAARARLPLLLPCVALPLLALAACNGGGSTCDSTQRGPETLDLGFVCDDTPETFYLTIVDATASGPCTVTCVAGGDSTTACGVVQVVPTGPGACDVSLTASNGAVFPLHYVYADEDSACSTGLVVVDGGTFFNPFERRCATETAGGG